MYPFYPIVCPNPYEHQARIQKIFPEGVQPSVRKKPITHTWILVLWIDSVWRITVEVHKYEK